MDRENRREIEMMIEKGNIVVMTGTNLQAQVIEVKESGMAFCKFLHNNETCELPLTMLDECKNTGRNVDGTFAEGHEGYKPNPDYKKEKESARKLQRDLLEGFAPLLRQLPNMVAKIEKPEMKVASIAKIMPFYMPALSRVEYNETAPRNVSLEVRLAEFKKEHDGEVKNNDNK